MKQVKRLLAGLLAATLGPAALATGGVTFVSSSSANLFSGAENGLFVCP